MRTSKKNNSVRGVEKIWMSNKEAQAYLGIGADFLEALRNSAMLHFYKVRNCIFYKVEDIDNLIISNKVI